MPESKKAPAEQLPGLFTFDVVFERALRPGNVVRLASDRVTRMTIEAVGKDDFDTPSARCVWLVPGGRAERATFALAALVRMEGE